MDAPYRFFCSCVDWDRDDVYGEGGLSAMIDGETTITRRTFLGKVSRDDLRALEQDLQYDAHPSQGLTMAGDWHVSYHRSTVHGATCYYFQHSGIEFVFKPETIDKD